MLSDLCIKRARRVCKTVIDESLRSHFKSLIRQLSEPNSQSSGKSKSVDSMIGGLQTPVNWKNSPKIVQKKNSLNYLKLPNLLRL